MSLHLDEEAIFDFARKIDSPQLRADYLDQVCGTDNRLKDRIAELLVSIDKQDSFLERPPVELGQTMDLPTSSEKAGDTIGPYRLLQEIGEGGFGVVYMAEQLRPVKRKVALKIIKPGMDSKEVIARFEAERQALALMDHPNIAKVFDGGTTESGRPYFVMELIKGVPLTEFCDKNRLFPEQRLKLFVKVCQAIQHAHQKGVIHRDIKPSNVMVTLNDNQPVPKVIDFGVAKAISQQLTEKTMFTTYGQMIGTPQYMSPEQAQMSGLDIDTRSDVYSLGVLLYELLTGNTPIDVKQLRNTAYAEMQRLICEVEPAKPSTKVSSLGESSMTIAQNRGIDARKLNLLLRGDLDWIVMTALDKDRNRRYESAGNFASDIEHYLAEEPILARPPSTGYKLNKFLHRNRTKVYGWTGAWLLLIVASVSILNTWSARSALRFKQQEQAIDDALNALRSMNWPEFEKTVQHAETLIDSKSAVTHRVWMATLQGRLAMEQGQFEDAKIHLEEAIKLDPSAVAPLANLAIAYGQGAQFLEQYRINQMLLKEDFQCKTADDHLFKGEALAIDYWFLEEAERELTAAISLGRSGSSSRAYQLRADVRKHIAMVSGNQELFEEALGNSLLDVEKALEFATDQTSIRVAKFDILVLSAFCFRTLGDEGQAYKQYEKATEIKEEFEVPDYANAYYYLFNKQDPDADAEFYRLLGISAQAGESSEWCYALETIARDDPAKGRTFLQSVFKDKNTSLAASDWAYFHAINGDKELADEYFSRTSRDKDDVSPEITVFLAMPVATLLGDTDFVTSTCTRLEKEILENKLELGASASHCLRLLSGQLDEETFLTLDDVRRDRHVKLMGLHTLASIRLSEGDNEGARRLVEEILKFEDFVTSIPYYQAKAILHKLENAPEWPDWIPRKNFE